MEPGHRTEAGHTVKRKEGECAHMIEMQDQGNSSGVENHVLNHRMHRPQMSARPLNALLTAEIRGRSFLWTGREPPDPYVESKAVGESRR